MRLSVQGILLISLSTLAFSEVTICFKKNHSDISTIESTKLDGGKCNSIKSQIDMQKENWKLDNFQLKDNGYLFIFKKESKEVVVKDVESLKSTIIAEIKTEKAKEVKISKAKDMSEKLTKGQNLFLKKCSSCHGLNGERKIANTKALNTISLERFQEAINGYKIGSYNLGNASEMKPYSVGTTSRDVKNIYTYIRSLDKK